MENRRITAIFLAFIAALLVMFAAKSCNDASKKKAGGNKVNNNQKSPTYASISFSKSGDTADVTADTQVYEVTRAQEEDDVEYITDLLGRVIGTSTLPPVSTTEPPTEPQVEYVTDLLGRVIEVIEPTTLPVTTAEETIPPSMDAMEKYWFEHPSTTKAEEYELPTAIHITID